jgi:hypothetical protein
LADFEVNPPITIPTGKIVFLDKFLPYVRNFYLDVFWVRHGCIKVEVLEVNRAEACTFPRQVAVEQELDKFKRCCVGANVAWVAYAIAPNSDAGAIGVIFLQAYFTNYHGVADFLLFVWRYVLIVDWKEGVSAASTLCGGGNARSDTLTETAQFIGVGGIPGSLVAGISTQLAVFKKFDGGWIEN